MKKALIYIIVLTTLMIVPSIQISNAVYNHQHVISQSSGDGMLVISNARGEYGKYWQWWPPGFVNKPQLMAESNNVFMHWGDEISNVYINEGKTVHRLYSYYWIVQHPSNTPNDLEDAIYEEIDTYSYHWNFIVLVGHSNSVAWEAYYWDHDHETYWTTNMLIPDNNNWAPPNYDTIAVINPSSVRSVLSDNGWYCLPHIVFIVGCDSLGKLTDTGGWAWGFYLSADDRSKGYWLFRGIVGFEGLVYYNWLTGDFKAAEMVKKMIEYMNEGYSSITAFKKATEDTGFPYKIYTLSSTSDLVISGKGDGDTYAVYIGDYAWQDPDYSEIALRSSIEFLKSYMPEIYNLVINNSIRPIITNKSGTWYARLTDKSVYSVSWRIPIKSERYSDIVYMLEIDMTIVVDNNIGMVKSISVGGSIYETPEILRKYTPEELLTMRQYIQEYICSNIETLKEYALIEMNNTPEIIGLNLIDNDQQNKIYQLVLKTLNAPIYVNDSYNIIPLKLELIGSETLFIYDNPLILLSEYIDSLSKINTSIISFSEAVKEFNDELSKTNNYMITRNLSLIILINTGDREITPYYYGIYRDSSGKTHFVFINAYTGKKISYIVNEAYVPQTGRQDVHDQLLQSILLIIVATSLLGITIYYMKRK